jgi:hypothetical protein
MLLTFLVIFDSEIIFLGILSLGVICGLGLDSFIFKGRTYVSFCLATLLTKVLAWGF